MRHFASIAGVLLVLGVLATSVRAEDEAKVDEDTQIVDFAIDGYAATQAFYLHNFEINPEGSTNTTEFIRYLVRLRPQVNLSEDLALLGRIFVLDGALAGNQGPDTDIFTGFGDATSQTNREGNEVESFTVDRVWIKYTMGFGQLRVGRQPANWGLGILANKGSDSIEFGNKGNGPIGSGDTVDRAFFLTDLSDLAPEFFGPDYHLLGAVAYDRVVEGDLGVGGDDLNHVVASLLFSNRKAGKEDKEVGSQELGVYNVWVSQDDTDTNVGVVDVYGRLAIPYRDTYELYIEFEGALEFGKTTRGGVVADRVTQSAEDFTTVVLSGFFQSTGSPPEVADARARAIAQRGTESLEERQALEGVLTEALIRELFIDGQSASELSRTVTTNGIRGLQNDEITVNAFAAVARVGGTFGPLRLWVEAGVSKDVGDDSVTPATTIGYGGGKLSGIGQANDAYLFGQLFASSLLGERYSLLPFDSEFDPSMILYEEAGPIGVDGRPAVTNTTYQRVAVEYDLADDWEVALNIILGQLVEEVETFRFECDAECVSLDGEGAVLVREKPSTDLGWEVDLSTTYAFNEWLTAEVKAGYFDTGDAFGSNADPVTAVKAQLVVELGERTW